MSNSHYIFIGWCCFRSVSSRHSCPIFAPWTQILPPLTRSLHMLFLSLSILCSVNLYLSFSSLFKPLFLKENISDLHVLLQSSSYLLPRISSYLLISITVDLTIVTLVAVAILPCVHIRYPLAPTPN